MYKPYVCYIYIVFTGIEDQLESGVKDVKWAQATFEVLGMSCASCVNKIEKNIAKKTGTLLCNLCIALLTKCVEVSLAHLQQLHVYTLALLSFFLLFYY